MTVYVDETTKIPGLSEALFMPLKTEEDEKKQQDLKRKEEELKQEEKQEK